MTTNRTIAKPFTAQGPQDLWLHFVPEYRSYKWYNWHVRFGWDDGFSNRVLNLSPKRAAKRIENYIIPEEMNRVRDRLGLGKRGGASIRFGREKTGHGTHGERGDFCLIGGIINPPTFTAFYRSVDLVGGFLYDLSIFDYVFRTVGVPIRTVEVFAASAHVLGLKGNSNEALYSKVRKLIHS